MLFMDRDTLDSMQLACRFMLDYVRKLEANYLALRQISRVYIGDVHVRRVDEPRKKEYWMPVIRLSRHFDDNELVFNCVHGPGPYLRQTFCELVEVCLGTIQSASVATYEIACGIHFGDLNARETHVDTLDVYSDHGSTDLLNRCVNAFKSVRKIDMTTMSDELIEPEAFNEAFFASLAHRRIEHFDAQLGVLEIDAATAFAYVFAEPMNGVSRELTGLQISVENDFLQLVKKKAGDVDSRQRVDLKAKIGRLFPDIDPAGFQKYEAGERKWVVNDLENGLTLEIESCTDDSTVFIHVYSLS